MSKSPSASVSASDLDKLIDAAKENSASEIVLNINGADKADKVSVELPKASVSAIAEKTDVSLKIDTPLGQITFDRRAMDEAVKAAKGDTIRIVLEKQTLSEEQNAQLGGSALLTDVSLWSGDTEITDLGSGKLTVSLPADSLKDKTIGAAIAAADGKLTAVEGKTVTRDGKTYCQITVSKTGAFVLAEKAKLDAAIAAQDEENPLIAGVEETTIKASTVLGDGYIKVKWTKSKGYKVDAYEIYRSTKRDSGYGEKAYYTTKQGGLKGWYKNTKGLKKGSRYYYKVRGVRELDGKKIYTKWSNIAYRTAK